MDAQTETYGDSDPDREREREQDARWWRENQIALRSLRAVGRSWGSPVWPDACPPTPAERMCIEWISAAETASKRALADPVAAMFAVPTVAVLEAIADDPCGPSREEARQLESIRPRSERIVFQVAEHVRPAEPATERAFDLVALAAAFTRWAVVSKREVEAARERIPYMLFAKRTCVEPVLLQAWGCVVEHVRSKAVAAACVAVDERTHTAAELRSLDAPAIAATMLARAVRSWDPDLVTAGIPHRYAGSVSELDPLFAASKHDQARADLRRESADLRSLKEANSRLRAAAAAMPKQDLDDGDTWDSLITAQTTVSRRAIIEGMLARDTRRAATDERWLRSRAALVRRTSETMRAVPRAVREGGKLPPTIERSMTANRVRWWRPVEAILRSEESWDEHGLAALILARGWFVDLVPFTRSRYGDEATYQKLRELIRSTRRR